MRSWSLRHPQNLQPRRRKTGCVVQSKSESLRTRGAHGRNPSPGTGERIKGDVPAQGLKQRKRKILPSLLVLLMLSTGWIYPLTRRR